MKAELDKAKLWIDLESVGPSAMEIKLKICEDHNLARWF